MTASGTTNTAFQWAIRTQDEILAVYPDCSEYQNLLETLSAFRAADEDHGMKVHGAIPKLDYAPTHAMLAQFCKVKQPGMLMGNLCM